MGKAMFINLRKIGITPQQWRELKQSNRIDLIFENENVKEKLVCWTDNYVDKLLK